MPLYEYLCSKCGEKFEVIQKFADTPLTVHESCGGSVERLISLSGFSLKGSGWYATDYAKSGSTSTKDSGGDSSKSKAEGKDAKDSKPAESKPAESKPAESKPSKSSESKTESKPSS